MRMMTSSSSLFSCLLFLFTISLFLCNDASAISISKLQHRLQSVLTATDGDRAAADAVASHSLQPPLKGIKPMENPKGATIVAGGVKAGVNPDIVLKAVEEKEFVEPTLVEINGEMETAHAPPAMFLPPNAAPANPLAARIAIRGGAGDTNPLPAANGGTFTYVFDVSGRVTQAWGFVVLKKRTNLAQAVHQYCDTLWYFSPSKFAGGVATNRVNIQWHSGHVIASALGGSDVDPINFFPQHSKSNSGGGIWWRVEMIVGAAKAVLAGLNPACQIMIRPTLDYTPLPNDWMPDRGIYYVEIDYGCAALYAGIGRPGGLAAVFHNWVIASVGSNMGAGDDPAFHYVNNVFGQPGGAAHGYRYGIPWLNTANKANTLNAAYLFN